jgi:exopolysaccharide production protein ExoQ
MLTSGAAALRRRGNVSERSKPRWCYWASIFFLLQTMSAFGIIDRLVYGEWFDKPGDKITESLNLLLMVASLLLFLEGMRQARAVKLGEILALGLTSFLFLSALWSIDPQTTLRRAVVYAYVVLGAIGIANILDSAEYMKLLRLSCALGAILSIALLVVPSGKALDSDSSSLRGIFANKEVLGEVMVVGVLASLHGIHFCRARRRLHIFSLLLFIVLAFASHASTRSLTTAALCGVDGIVSLLRKNGIGRIFGSFLIMCLIPIIAFAVLNMDWLLAAIGKDPTLTGRTDLWPYIVVEIFQKPMLGWGFSAFWSYAGGPASEISNAVGWPVANAHNALLELLLEVGFIGAGFFVLLLTRNIVLSFRCIRTSASELAISSLLCCVAICLIGISETELTDPFQALTSMFFITGIMCERTIRDARRRDIRY